MAPDSSLRNKSSNFLSIFASAGQLIRKTQPGHRAALSAAVNRFDDSLVPRSNVSSIDVKSNPSSDENLLRVIESEITCAQEMDEFGDAEEVPSNFPFKIIDSPGQ
ncbi:uncharacterized protein LOC131634598 [Vicia villosa]|uniref:uncharacterized protein LOC131634598 n=1 Tax=Vicia villosa TaxID=3911 RepID=UPI00273BBBCE|nr:uncharacterized protein LOC131634598 [Vicia villosa]